MKVSCMLQGKMQELDCVRINHYTIWVETPDGNIIKRHKKKHAVVSIGE